MIFGQERPASWPAGMVPAAIAAGNTAPRSADPVVDLLAAAQSVAEAEYNPTGAAVATGWQYRAAASRADAFTASPVGRERAFPLTVAGLGIQTDAVLRDTTYADVVVADWSNVLTAYARTSRSTSATARSSRTPTGTSSTTLGNVTRPACGP